VSQQSRRLTPSQAAEKVFPHIPFTPGTGLAGHELADRAGISLDQVYEGVAFLRENFPDDPLIASSRDGYHWTYDPKKVGAFQQWRALSAQTTMRRLWRGAVKPYVEEKGVPGQSEFLTKQFERLLEDIGSLMKA
jgi:hypothetical protein